MQSHTPSTVVRIDIRPSIVRITRTRTTIRGVIPITACFQDNNLPPTSNPTSRAIFNNDNGSEINLTILNIMILNVLILTVLYG